VLVPSVEDVLIFEYLEWVLVLSVQDVLLFEYLEILNVCWLLVLRIYSYFNILNVCWFQLMSTYLVFNFFTCGYFIFQAGILHLRKMVNVSASKILMWIFVLFMDFLGGLLNDSLNRYFKPVFSVIYAVKCWFCELILSTGVTILVSQYCIYSDDAILWSHMSFSTFSCTNFQFTEFN